MKNLKTTSRTFLQRALLAVIFFALQLNIFSQQSSGEYNYFENMNSTALNVKISGTGEIPADLFKLSSLEELTLTGDALTEIPADIKKLNTLLVLNISGTSVEVLPKELSQLMQLKELRLNYEKWQYKLDHVRKITKAKIILE
jgi:Leucine-rich repeat (LRR) protein